MTDIKPGDVFWVTVTSEQVVGHEQHSRRPYVVVSRLLVNRQGNLVVGLPLTTAGAELTTHPPYRIRIPASEIARDVMSESTIRNCVALVDQVRVLDKTRLEKRLGTLSNTALAAVGLGLAYIFDLR